MARIDGGFVILPRKIRDSEIRDAPPLQRWLFVEMLLRANHKDRNGLKRGQLFTTIREMQEAMSYRIGYRRIVPTKDQIRRAYERLTKAAMIATTKTTRGIVVTICDYDDSQDFKNYERHTERHTEKNTNATDAPHYTQSIKSITTHSKKAGWPSFDVDKCMIRLKREGLEEEDIRSALEVAAKTEKVKNPYGFVKKVAENNRKKREWEKDGEREREWGKQKEQEREEASQAAEKLTHISDWPDKEKYKEKFREVYGVLDKPVNWADK